jgi:predicted transcriptional regulator YheO
MDQNQVFEILKVVGSSIAKTLGPACEVLLHTTANPEESIIWMEGNVTGRNVGGPMTNIGLTALQTENPPEDLVNYATQTSDGRPLKSATIFLRDEQGKIFGIFCINIDLSRYIDLRSELDEFIKPDRQLQMAKSFSPDLNTSLASLVEESFRQFQGSNGPLNREDRIKLIAHLNSKGFFRTRKSVSVLADRLNVSRYTLYNDLKEVRGEP